MCNSTVITTGTVITVLLGFYAKPDFYSYCDAPITMVCVWVTLVAMVLQHNTTDIPCGFLFDCIIVIFATL